jgi:hypothetical protein
MSIQVLDGRFMPPGDFVDCHAENGSDFLPFRRARRPAAKRDRRDTTFVEAAALGEFGDGDLMSLAKVGDGGHACGQKAESKEQKKVVAILP